MAFIGAAAGLGVFYGGVIVGVPTVTGVAEGVHHQKEQNKLANDSSRMVKFHLEVFCEAKSSYVGQVHGANIVLRDNKVYLSKTVPSEHGKLLQGPEGHPFTGFYVMYPDDDRNPKQLGLVSTVSDDPPMLNWLYVDRNTLELRYGNRTQSIQHIVGPWDWTEDDQVGLLLEDWEGFVAVEEEKGVWAMYYDINDDRLARGKKVGGRRVLQCSLERRVFDEARQKADMEAQDKKLRVKKTGGMSLSYVLSHLTDYGRSDHQVGIMQRLTAER